MSTTVTGKNGNRGADSVLAILPGGIGGAGETVSVSDNTASDNATVAGYGGDGGAGGNGASPLSGLPGNGSAAGAGGAGGGATASSVFSYSAVTVVLNARATGGVGGSPGIPGKNGPGAAAGKGGAASASAGATNTAVGGTAEVNATSTGGQGGANGGNGQVGGAGGVASGTTAAAHAQYRAVAGVTQQGGQGGTATGTARGGTGAASTLTNAVTGSTTGGHLYLRGTARGGAGGDAQQGAGGAGGSATSSQAFNDALTNPITSSITAVQAYAEGGNGGTGGKGGAGGNATATTTVIGAHVARGYAQGQGGKGGSIASGQTGSGQAGGRGTASVTATTTSASASAFARSYGSGGVGGTGRGVGQAGGSGGVGSAFARAVAVAYASAIAGSTGGDGGDGLDGADAGKGGSVALVNRVSGVTSNGTLRLTQTAVGGNGGVALTPSGPQGTGGAGGDALSQLTVNDITASPTRSDTLIATVRAQSGRGGSGTITGAGGNATAGVSVTGARSVEGHAEALGRTGGTASVRTGGSGGNGGGASASVTVVSTSTTRGATAFVDATGGAGGNGRKAGYSGGKGGDIGRVTGTATGHRAAVYLNATGGNGGIGAVGAAGGDGGSVHLVDAVSGRATGSALILFQYAQGGRGGGSTSGSGGAGGAAYSDSRITTPAADAASASTTIDMATVQGGYGGFGAVTGGIGGSAHSTQWLTTGTVLSVEAHATGGAGGGVGGGVTSGALAGSGGSAAADARGIGLLREIVGAVAEAIGGVGGDAGGAGPAGGTGGVANATAVGIGRTVALAARQTGGAGGAGGATGGAGADTTMIDRVGGGSTGGSIALESSAQGGAGGNTTGSATPTSTAGSGGAAISRLTFDDRADGRLSATTLTGESNATGGAGGVATTDGSHGKAGAGDASILLSGAGVVTGVATAKGGNAGVRNNTNAAAGVDGATATAQAAASTSSAMSKASASAVAIAGTGSAAIGAGNTGGAGGSASILATTATGPIAEATGQQVGGNGGAGLYGAKGGKGADSVVTNRVAGQAPGGMLFLNQAATAGSGGDAPGGIAGAGGYAASTLTIDGSDATTGAARLTGKVTAIGGAGGQGSIGTGTGGHDASDLAGGAAYARSQMKGRTVVTADINVTGGAGGGTTDGDADGAAGGVASGVADAQTTGLTPSERATTHAYFYGGNGGRANGAGRTGGAGGSVGPVHAYSTGSSAASYLTAFAGRGGAGTAGAAGGAGGSVTLTNAVQASARRGDINLLQAAIGGAGGDGMYGGDAGDAVSSLTFDDTLNPVAARSLVGEARASSASGGFGSVRHGTPSDAVANLNLRAINRIVGYAAAYGGDSSDRGGNATATSKATVLGSGATAFAYARAFGGTGLTRGTASAMSAAETADGARAQATARAIGTNAIGDAAATTHTSDIVTTVAAHAIASSAIADAEVNAGTILTGPSAGYEGYVLATAAPDAAAIAAVVTKTANVAAALGPDLTAIVGTGLMGGQSTPFNTQYAGHTDWTLNTTMRSGRLVLALTEWFGASANIASMTVSTSVDGVTVTDATFTDTASAKAYVSDNVLDLGATPVGEAVSVSVSYSIQFADASSDFAFRYVLAATNTAVSDTIAPLAPGLTIPRADDTGAFDFDRVTKLAQPRLGGIAEPAAFVDIYDGGVLLDTTTASLTGGWTYTPAVALAEGKHTLTAIARDAAGNGSLASPALVLEIDTTAPTTPAAPDLLERTDRGSSSTDDLTSAGPLSFTGTAGAFDSVELFDGATSLGITVADESGNWTLDSFTVLAAGTHDIIVRLTDLAGNTSLDSLPLVVTVDTAIAPPAALDLLMATDSGRARGDNITQEIQPWIAGTAETGATIRLFDGITLLGTATANALGKWRITSTPLADGVHSLVAQATDAAGNVSDTSDALLVTIDTVAPDTPVMTLDPASDSGTAGDMVTSIVTPLIRGTAEAGSVVNVYNGASLLGTRTSSTTGAWSLVLPTLAAGVNVLTLTATDVAGNTVTTDVSLEIDLQALPPSAPDLDAASDLGLSATDDITGDTTPTFTGTAEALSTVTLLDGKAVLGTGTAGLDGKWSITSVALAPGDHAITARLVDRAGNASAESAATTVTIDTTPADPPGAPDLDAGSDSGGSDSDNLTRVRTPVFTGATQPGVTVVLYDGDTEIGRTTADGGGKWSIASSSLADGDHFVTARQTNLPGNLGAASAALVVRIDGAATAPSVPDLNGSYDTGRAATDNLTRRTTLGFTGKSEAKATVTLREGTTVLGTGTASATGAWSIMTSVLTEGVHLITAEQVDLAGNAGPASFPASVRIDTTAPAVAAIGRVSPTVASGTAEALASVTVYEGATALGTAIADGTGAWSAAVALAAGAHTLTTKATDVAGNISSLSAPRVVIAGSAGDDVLFTPGADATGGGMGNDLYLVDDGADAIWEAPGEGADTVLAAVGYTLPALASFEFLFADSAAGLALGGNELVNTIRGGAGADTLTGGGGGDTLMGSGGVDTFRYTSLSDSTTAAGQLDTILDFNVAAGEKLDLATLDADLTVGGDQAFAFMGTAAFSGAAGQLRYQASGGNTLVTADVNGDASAEFAILLTGSHVLGAGNFVL